MSGAPDHGMTARFARFVEEFRFEDIPADAVTRTKQVLYDGIGSALSASSPRFDILGVLEGFVDETAAAGHAQVIGSDRRTNCVTAALVNGTLGYYIDRESHHPGAIMHAIAVVGPAALAVGESIAAAGRDVLAAIVLGIDVACRMSYALSGTALYARGFHPTCVAGTFGAMAAAARLRGLRGERMLHAFGLAGTQASGLLAWVSEEREHARPFNMGLASRNGTYAAELAACGLSGPPAIFEGKYPVGAAFTGEWHEEALFDGLRERFMVMELYFKLYSCCAFIHPGLDGLLDILQGERVAADSIERMTLRFPSSGYRVIDGNPLRSHCAQYVLALAAVRGEVDFADILHDRRSEPAIGRLAERVRVVGDDELDRTYPDLYRSVIEVETRDGRRYTRDVTHPRGSPVLPLSDDQLRRKFRHLTRGIVTDARADEIEHAVSEIDRLQDVRALTRLLGREAVRA